MPPTFHRYLVPFDTRRLPRIQTDVLVIGSGVSGLRLAVETAREASTLLVTKAELTDSNSDWAQGGIAAPIGPNDSLEQHVEDTLTAGAGLCDRAIVEAVVARGPAAIDEMRAWGAAFDRTADGEIAMTTEGGHSAPRVLHARGDSTGAELVAALASAAEAAPLLRMVEHAYIVDLVTDDEGTCRGALLFTRHGEFQLVEAHVTVLATGGLGRLFRETTNPRVATGDGVAMAFRAGATLSDLEFVQFHPTTLYIAGAPRHLISEAVRGEGAVLRNGAGERFMESIHPRAELAPRDVVSRAILDQLRSTGDAFVQLDLTHLDADRVLQRFPRLAQLCHTFRLDIRHETIPVRPSAHYAVGGVVAELDGTTSIPRLLVCGEAAATGLHGANRLASNSLLEGLVCGLLAGRRALELASSPPTGALVASWEAPPVDDGDVGAIDMEDLERSLRSAMWRQVGIIRDAEGLDGARRQFEFWGRYVWQRTFFGATGWSLQNMLTLGWLMAELALAREESRGVHARDDFPERAAVARHSLFDRASMAVGWRDAR